MAIVITWVTEVTETYTVSMDEADLLEKYGTLDPEELKDQIDTDDLLAGEEDEEHRESATVEERYVDEISVTS